MEKTDAMKQADQRQAKLMSLALKSLADDIPPLLAGAEISEDPLDPATWFEEDEHEKAKEIDELLRTIRDKLEALGCRGLVYIASENYLAKDTVE